MSQSNEQYTFEPIVITQDEIEYYRGLRNNILNNFILNFRDHIEVIDNQLYYLKHQFFVVNRKNLIETLDWDEVHQTQQSYINRKTELLQQKELKERKIQIIESILSERGYNRNNRNQSPTNHVCSLPFSTETTTPSVWTDLLLWRTTNQYY